MAGLWYRAGTISVTNGSKKVTGFGTLWKSTTFKPDKGHAFYGQDGKAYEIDYVESDTVLYLVMVYAGATANTQAYSIDITRTSTIPAFSRELSAQLTYAQAQYDSWQQVLTGSGTVTLTAPDGQQIQVPALSAMQQTSNSLKALQALTPAKDKLPVFNGASGADLITLTAFMRTLLDDANKTEALATLGAMPATAQIPAGADLNNYKATGTFQLAGAASNLPTGATNYGLLSVIFWPNVGGQTYKNYHDSRTWERSFNPNVDGGKWTIWTEVFTQSRVVGVVSQSGGIPTGAIIERGSNANGEYVRFADGTQWCWGAQNITDTPVTAGAGGIFQSGILPSQTFPIAFLSVRLFHNVGYSSGGARPWSLPVVTNVSNFSILLQAGQSMTAFNGAAYWMAIGRWY